ncbi:MAG: RICIN domain-containing protein, partial [Mucilaginibacter sp.]
MTHTCSFSSTKHDSFDNNSGYHYSYQYLLNNNFNAMRKTTLFMACMLFMLLQSCSKKEMSGLVNTGQKDPAKKNNWVLGDPMVDGVYVLYNQNNKCIQAASNTNGSLVQQNAYIGYPNQQWKFLSVGGGYFKILNYLSNKALDVPSSNPNAPPATQNLPLQIWTYTGTDNQHWKIEHIAWGQYKITNKYNGLAVTLSGNSSANLAPITQTTYAQDAAHLWRPDKIVPVQNTIVAAYYFPNFGPYATSEWPTIVGATPQWTGHLQPKVPVWGTTNEQTPTVMASKITAAAANGIDAFIFDWYYYNSGKHPDLDKALDLGYLNASNNNLVKFGILWCNHDLQAPYTGIITPAAFHTMCDYVIANYFNKPSYLKINGCPYFSIYLVKDFVSIFGSISAAKTALNTFRQKVKNAGY